MRSILIAHRDVSFAEQLATQLQASGYFTIITRDHLNTITSELRDRLLPIQVKVDVRVGDPASGIAMAAMMQG